MQLTKTVFEDTPWTPGRFAIFACVAIALHLAVVALVPDGVIHVLEDFAERGELSYPSQLDLIVLMSLILLIPATVSTEFWENEPFAPYVGCVIAAPSVLILVMSGETSALASFILLTGTLVLYYAFMREDVAHPSRHAAVVTIMACSAWVLLPALACGALAGFLFLCVLVSALLALNQTILAIKFKLFYE